MEGRICLKHFKYIGNDQPFCPDCLKENGIDFLTDSKGRMYFPADYIEAYLSEKETSEASEGILVLQKALSQVIKIAKGMVVFEEKNIPYNLLGEKCDEAFLIKMVNILGKGILHEVNAVFDGEGSIIDDEDQQEKGEET